MFFDTGPFSFVENQVKNDIENVKLPSGDAHSVAKLNILSSDICKMILLNHRLTVIKNYG